MLLVSTPSIVLKEFLQYLNHRDKQSNTVLINAINFKCIDYALELAKSYPQLIGLTNNKGISALSKLLIYVTPDFNNFGRNVTITSDLLQLYSLLQPETVLPVFSDKSLNYLIKQPLLLRNTKLYREICPGFSFVRHFAYYQEQLKVRDDQSAELAHMLLNSMTVFSQIAPEDQ